MNLYWLERSDAGRTYPDLLVVVFVGPILLSRSKTPTAGMVGVGNLVIYLRAPVAKVSESNGRKPQINPNLSASRISRSRSRSTSMGGGAFRGVAPSSSPTWNVTGTGSLRVF